MKSDRLVSLLLMLQARSPRSARELAQALEVSARTIYRDVEALSVSGVPVYAERGSSGGIALADGYRRAITQFSTEELHALFLAAADPLAELGVTGHQRALDKLAGALPDLQRRAAQQARQRILLDHNRWYRLEQPAALLAVLRRAVWED
ncbi:MAG TPA: HTH domain-containing protein, partial [Candidatus Baltobacteraceae bacterium]|nr:HTH domain-containing protein [Candidatus Baltobacteraceae bacterium]